MSADFPRQAHASNPPSARGSRPGAAVGSRGARVLFITLGCPKNIVDSELMMAQAEEHGFALVWGPGEADIIVVNTCAFIEDAQRESIEEILRAAQWKERRRGRLLVVAGCLAERHGAQLLREIPEADAIVGPGRLSRMAPVLAALLGGARRGENRGLVEVGVFEPVEALRRRMRTGSVGTAYVKISEGCDHRCAFCLIPRLRGPQRSRPADSIVEETELLAREGVREVVLVAQDTTAYGRDLPERPTLADLLRRLGRCDGPPWIRVMYTHPNHWTNELIDVFAEGGRILPYVDIPVQHISDSVLKAMARGHDGPRIRELVKRLRERIRGLVIRTTVMTGHPGEGPGEFAELLQFLREFLFDRLGAFAYSPEDGTRSAGLKQRAARKEAKARRARVLELQRQLSVSLQKGRKGSRLELLIDGVHAEKKYAIGRSYGEAPDIDGVVYMKVAGAKGNIEPGDLVSARIVGAGPYDLVAVACDSAPRQCDQGARPGVEARSHQGDERSSAHGRDREGWL